MVTIIGNLKGGSGKSTVTFNLALWLVQAGKQVSVYDLDRQKTLSDAAQVRQEEEYEPHLTVHLHFNKLQKSNELDEILIDVGAANIEGMKRAISLADRIIVPVLPGQADIWSTQRFLHWVAKELQEKKPKILMFINRADTHRGIHESDEAEEVLSTLPGVQVLKTRLHQRVTYRRSFSEGLAVFELEPSGKAAREFEEFAKQLYLPNHSQKG